MGMSEGRLVMELQRLMEPRLGERAVLCGPSRQEGRLLPETLLLFLPAQQIITKRLLSLDPKAPKASKFLTLSVRLPLLQHRHS